MNFTPEELKEIERCLRIAESQMYSLRTMHHRAATLCNREKFPRVESLLLAIGYAMLSKSP